MSSHTLLNDTEKPVFSGKMLACLNNWRELILQLVPKLGDEIGSGYYSA